MNETGSIRSCLLYYNLIVNIKSAHLENDLRSDEKMDEEIVAFKLKNYKLSSQKKLNEIKYFENGIELMHYNEDGTNIPYTEEQFKNKIKHNVETHINNKFENVILLSGAGTSISGDPRNIFGKTMVELWIPIEESLVSDVSIFNLEQLSKLINFNIIRDKEGKVNSNLEDFISQVLQYESFIKNEKEIKKYVKTIERIYETIVKNTSYSYDDSIFNHSAIIKMLNESLNAPSRLTVVTTNYDLMFEQAAAELNYTVIDGFTFSQKPKFNSDLYNWNLVKSVKNVSTKELEYKRSIMNLLKIHGSINWYEVNGEIYKNYDDVEDNPVMIFPNTRKYAQSYKPPYFALFSKFQELLTQNNTLLITSGFSFGDLHIASIVENSLKNNNGLQLLVTDFNINNKLEEGWATLEGLSQKNYPVTFLQSSFNELNYYLEGI